MKLVKNGAALQELHYCGAVVGVCGATVCLSGGPGPGWWGQQKKKLFLSCEVLVLKGLSHMCLAHFMIVELCRSCSSGRLQSITFSASWVMRWSLSCPWQWRQHTRQWWSRSGWTQWWQCRSPPLFTLAGWSSASSASTSSVLPSLLGSRTRWGPGWLWCPYMAGQCCFL